MSLDAGRRQRAGTRSVRRIRENVCRIKTTRGRLMPMDERERTFLRHLYDLQMELFRHQGDEIEALRKANESLRRSHEVIGDMLKVTAGLLGVGEH